MYPRAADFNSALAMPCVQNPALNQTIGQVGVINFIKQQRRFFVEQAEQPCVTDAIDLPSVGAAFG